MDKQQPDPLSVTFAALADPTRRAILARLANGEATVNELAEPFSMSMQAVSKHLKVLERAGLISRGRAARLRPSRSSSETSANSCPRASFIAEPAHPASNVTASATIRIRIAFAHQEKADCITAARRIVLLYFIYTATPSDDSRTLSRH